MREAEKTNRTTDRTPEPDRATARALGLALLEAACAAVRTTALGTLERSRAAARLRALATELEETCRAHPRPHPAAPRLLDAAHLLTDRTLDAPRYGNRPWTEACIELNGVLGELAPRCD